jgi:hypothetical protein
LRNELQFVLSGRELQTELVRAALPGVIFRELPPQSRRLGADNRIDFWIVPDLAVEYLYSDFSFFEALPPTAVARQET